MYSRRSLRFRGDRVSLAELVVLLALVLVILMLAFDSVSWRVLAFFEDLIHTVQ